MSSAEWFQRKCGHNLRIDIRISPPGSEVGDTASKLTLKDIVSRRVYVTARWPSVVFMQCCDECQSGLSDPHHVAMLDARDCQTPGQRRSRSARTLVFSNGPVTSPTSPTFASIVSYVRLCSLENFSG